MNRTFLCLVAIAVLAILNVGGSCASDGQHGHDDRRDGSPDRPYRIPSRADTVREGWGKQKWTADMDGVVFVFDKDKNALRYTGDIRRGEEVVVDPERDRISISREVVYERNLEKRSWHKIYFISNRDYDRERG